jgi:hypothetical protein
MAIAARMALHTAHVSPASNGSSGSFARDRTSSGADAIRPDYHGTNVLLRQLSPKGFVADPNASFKSGAFVRLRLPGAGVMVAKLVKANRRQLSGEFVNPVSASRLSMVLGLKTLA